MKKIFTLLLFTVFSLPCFSQSGDSLILKKNEKWGFMPGDIIISPNIGWPHVTPTLIRASIHAYQKLSDNQQFTFTLTSHGVYNVKAEYGLLENLGLGLAGSYWDMDFKMQNNYQKDGTPYTDDIDVKMTAKAIGVRGNFHFIDELESTWCDVYVGGTIGSTYYEKTLSINSTNPDRQIGDAIPKKILNFNSGWATYFSTTAGVRVYPVRCIGLNAELGWDRGAFLFFGLAVRFATKPIKSFQD